MCVAKTTCRSRLPAFGPQIIVLAQTTGEVRANSPQEPFYYNLLLLIYQVLRKKAGNAYQCSLVCGNTLHPFRHAIAIIAPVMSWLRASLAVQWLLILNYQPQINFLCLIWNSVAMESGESTTIPVGTCTLLMHKLSQVRKNTNTIMPSQTLKTLCYW